MTKPNASRRAFLNTASALSGLCATGGGLALNLATIGSAAAQAAPTDYKAIVCLFMVGGCDNANTVLATDAASWAPYAAVRDVRPVSIALAHPNAPVAGRTVLPIGNLDPAGINSGRQFGLHPNLGPMKALYDNQRAAIIANIGPLKQPTTRAQFFTRKYPLPDKLFSHNDQQATWMAFGPEGTATTGWGGMLGDLFMAANQYPVFTGISAAGNSVFLTGKRSVQYQIGTSNAIGINALGGFWGINGTETTLSTLIQENRTSLFEQEHNLVVKRSMAARDAINGAIALAPTFTNPFPNTGIGNQLGVVARMIAGRNSIGQKRQVFFVNLGGFDNHDGLFTGHSELMTQLGAAVSAFQSAMAQLGVDDKVTLFTGSEFGRTLTSNGDGSDHGWGSHHFVVGGAVRGGQVYGRFPEIGVDTNDDIGQGRLVPGVPVDQLAGALGRWFGVSDTDLLTLMPNLRNFGSGSSAAAKVASALAPLSMLA